MSLASTRLRKLMAGILGTFFASETPGLFVSLLVLAYPRVAQVYAAGVLLDCWYRGQHLLTKARGDTHI